MYEEVARTCPRAARINVRWGRIQGSEASRSALTATLAGRHLPGADTEPVTDLSELTARMRAFTDARDWGQFHDLKSLTLALTGEVGEVAELVQWLPASALENVADGRLRNRLGEELADVLLYLVRLADVAGVDLGSAALEKLQRNESRFPADGHRGVAPDRH